MQARRCTRITPAGASTEPKSAAAVGLLVWSGRVVKRGGRRTPKGLNEARKASLTKSIQGFWLDFGGAPSELRLGDRLRRVGEADLRGVGHIGFNARAIEQAGADLRVPVELERAGKRMVLLLELERPGVAWGRIPAALAMAVVCAIVLLRAPRAFERRWFFAVFMLGILAMLPFYGKARLQTYASEGLFFALAWLVPSLLLSWAMTFPPEARRPGRLALALPWLLAPAYGVLRWSYLFGGPVPPHLVPYGVATADALFFAGGLAIVVWRYRQSNPVGRRRMKWLLYGAWVCAVPVGLTSILALTESGSRAYWQMLNLSGLAVAAFPIGMLIAIVRQNLFDIDRLIGATASYSGVLLVLVGVAGLVAPLGQAAGGALGIAPWSGQLAMVFALAALGLPLERRLRPRVERVLFAERHRVERGLELLLAELPGQDDPKELLQHAQAGLERLLRPESSLLYLRNGPRFEAISVRGQVAVPSFDSEDPLVAVLRRLAEPLAADPTASVGQGSRLRPFERATLETLGVSVVVPIRRSEELVAFLCLGPKLDGDIYTSTDLAWLAAIAHGISRELLRFEERELLRRGQELQTALRRYVPNPVAEHLYRGRSLEPTRLEVSVVFVDIRGFSTLAEQLEPEQVVAVVNRHNEWVSDG
jgi:hypothetical protein